MIKFIVDRNGKKLLGLGLSEMNVQKLKEKKPIHIFGDEVGLPGVDVVIMYGETEQEIIDELSPHIDKNTNVHKEPGAVQ